MNYRPKSALCFPVICLFLLLASCATSDDVGRVQWELDQLRKKTDSLEERLPGGKGQFSGLEESQKATAKAVSDLYIRTQEISKDLQRVNGQLEESRYEADKRREEEQKSRTAQTSDIQAMKTELEGLHQRVAAIEESVQAGDVTGQAKTITGKEPPSEKSPDEQAEETPEEQVEEKPRGVPGGTAIKDVYMHAYEAFKAGRNREAREKFTAFIRDYPENEYTDNARFWIAESYYSEKSYEDAILSYEELFRKNPDSDKVPGAMLKQGMSFYELKDKATGSLILNQLVEKFPDSEQAAIARRKLEESSPTKK